MTTTPQTVLSPLEQARDERLFPVLTPEQLARATSHGTSRSVEAEDVLLKPGAETGSIFIVLRGQVDIARQSCEEEIVVVRLGPGQFTGEVAALTGQQSMVTGSSRSSERGHRDRPRLAPADRADRLRPE